MDKIFYDLYNNSYDAFLLTTPNSQILKANPAACELFEMSEAEMLIGGRAAIVDMEDPNLPILLQAREQYGRVKGELRMKRKSGEIFIAEVSSVLFKNSQGEVYSCMLIRDISQQKQLEKKITTLNSLLKSENADISATLNAYQLAIDVNIISSLSDINGNIIYANKKFCEISGYTQGELIGKNHNILNSGFHSRDFFTDLWNTINSGEVWHGELLNKAKDGTAYWVDTIILPVKNASEKIVQFLSLRVLINEKKRLEHEKRQYTQNLEQIIFSVSHDIRLPITHLQGITELVKHGNVNMNDLPTLLSAITGSVEKLDRITRGLTDFISHIKKQ